MEREKEDERIIKGEGEPKKINIDGEIKIWDSN